MNQTELTTIPFMNITNIFILHTIHKSEMPVDPVCGIELAEEDAIEYEYKGKRYYFCCDGCKKIFVKKPKKYA